MPWYFLEAWSTASVRRCRRYIQNSMLEPAIQHGIAVSFIPSNPCTPRSLPLYIHPASKCPSVSVAPSACRWFAYCIPRLDDRHDPLTLDKSLTTSLPEICSVPQINQIAWHYSPAKRTRPRSTRGNGITQIHGMTRLQGGFARFGCRCRTYSQQRSAHVK